MMAPIVIEAKDGLFVLSVENAGITIAVDDLEDAREAAQMVAAHTGQQIDDRTQG